MKAKNREQLTTVSPGRPGLTVQHFPALQGERMNPTVFFFLIYAALGSGLVFVSYLVGSMVERAFGSEASMICFLAMFMASLIGSFPIAMKLTPDEAGAGAEARR